MPAVLRSASSGKSFTNPVIAAILTPGSATRRAVTRSPIACTLRPNTSKPTATLPTLAGAKAVADWREPARASEIVITAWHRDKLRHATDRQTRRRRLLQDRRPALARPKDSDCSDWC